MIELVVKDYDDNMTLLEAYLLSKDIKYDVIVDKGEFGLACPYIIVDGAPLDECRAFKWLLTQ